MASDRRASRQAVRVAFRPPEQGCLVQAELRFNGLSRDSGVRAKSAASIGTHRASRVAAKAVVMQQKVRLFLVQLIDKGFGCRVHTECREQTLAKGVRESDG